MKIREVLEDDILKKQETISDLNLKLTAKIQEIQKSREEAALCLDKLKASEEETRRLKEIIKDLKHTYVRLQNDSKITAAEIRSWLGELQNEVFGSHKDLRLLIAKLMDENGRLLNSKNAEISESRDVYDETGKDESGILTSDVCDSDFTQILNICTSEASESFIFNDNSSTTISENGSQTSSSLSPSKCYYPIDQSGFKKSLGIPPSPQSLSIPGSATGQQVSTSAVSTHQVNESSTSWLLIISFIIVVLAVWINLNGTLLGKKPQIYVHFSSMPPS